MSEEVSQEDLEAIEAWMQFEQADSELLGQEAIDLIELDDGAVIFYEHPDEHDANAPHGVNEPGEMEITNADPITD